MAIKERLLEFIEQQGISKREFAKLSGISNGYIDKMSDNISQAKVENILQAFPMLNRNWLTKGEGEMLRKETDISIQENSTLIPLLPVEAVAGYNVGFAQSVELRDCRKIQSPIPGADYAIQITGDSMEPALKSGSIVYIKKIDEKIFIPWGNIVVIDTENGAVVKEIFPCEEDPERYIIAKSINPKFPPYKIMTSGIYGIYKVLGSSFINSTL